jgi:hypothetical protein
LTERLVLMRSRASVRGRSGYTAYALMIDVKV